MPALAVSSQEQLADRGNGHWVSGWQRSFIVAKPKESLDMSDEGDVLRSVPLF